MMKTTYIDDNIGEENCVSIRHLGSNFISCMFASSSPTTMPKAAPSEMNAVDNTVWLSMSFDTSVSVKSPSRHTRNCTLLHTSAMTM